MSNYFADNGKFYVPEYKDGRTKQAFRDAADVNKILRKHIKAGTLEQIAQVKGEYGDFSDFDYMDAQLRVARAKELFEKLPGELRNEFNGDPGAFLSWANDPANQESLERRLSDAINPGRQINVRRTNQMASVEPSTETPVAVAPAVEEPAEGDTGGEPA